MTIRDTLTGDVEDYFQVSAFAENINRKNWDSHPLRVEKTPVRHERYGIPDAKEIPHRLK